MRIQVFALLAAAAAAIAQGVTDKIPPKGAAPDGCKASLDGKFEITVVELNKLNNKVKKDHAIQTRGNCGGDGTLVLQLADTVLTDNHNRTGYIASNFQFQFDNPPQAGALYTAGFSYCTNGSLALGSTTVFYRCLSGNFYNLYDRWWAAQCDPVEIIVMPCGGEAGQTGGNNPSQTVVGTQVITTTIVSPLSDGQPQVIVTTIPVPICQIGDGQIQAHTTPCSAAATASGPPVSQYSDGQVQVTPVTSVNGPPASQYSDGQVQVTPVSSVNGPPASEYSDGQVQVTPVTSINGPPASQYSDGQVQVTPVSSASEPAAKTTVAQAATPSVPSGDVSVPTSAPGTNGAGGVRAPPGVVALVAALGLGGIVWFW